MLSLKGMSLVYTHRCECMAESHNLHKITTRNKAKEVRMVGNGMGMVGNYVLELAAKRL